MLLDFGNSTPDILAILIYCLLTNSTGLQLDVESTLISKLHAWICDATSDTLAKLFGCIRLIGGPQAIENTVFRATTSNRIFDHDDISRATIAMINRQDGNEGITALELLQASMRRLASESYDSEIAIQSLGIDALQLAFRKALYEDADDNSAEARQIAQHIFITHQIDPKSYLTPGLIAELFPNGN